MKPVPRDPSDGRTWQRFKLTQRDRLSARPPDLSSQLPYQLTVSPRASSSVYSDCQPIVPLLLFGLSQLNSFGEDYELEVVPDAKQLAGCERLLGMTFPKSTLPIRMHYRGGWLDDSMQLKIEIAKEDIPALIRASPFAGAELSETENRMWAVQDLNWWDPETVKTFQYGETQLPDVSYLRILIDTGKERVAVVYLKWFQT